MQGQQNLTVFLGAIHRVSFRDVTNRNKSKRIGISSKFRNIFEYFAGT